MLLFAVRRIHGWMRSKTKKPSRPVYHLLVSGFQGDGQYQALCGSKIDFDFMGVKPKTEAQIRRIGKCWNCSEKIVLAKKATKSIDQTLWGPWKDARVTW